MKYRTLVLTVVAMLMASVPVAVADKESPELAKFRPQIERSVNRGLAFLAKQQLSSQQASAMGKPTLAGCFSPNKKGNLGISALAVKAFLSKGHTPGRGPYGNVINRGIDFIMSYHEKGVLMTEDRNNRDPRGKMYSHSIATLVLAEVSGMVDPYRQTKIDRVLPLAVGVLVTAQQVKKNERDQGGWRYEPHAKDSDLSLSGWSLMALRASKINGAAVPEESIDNAVRFILRCHDPKLNGFGYTPRKSGTMAMTGAALLCLNLCGEHNNKLLQPAGEYILRQMAHELQRQGGGRFVGIRHHGYYQAYYCFQGMFQLGGFMWETWAKQMYPNLLNGQKADGSWPATAFGSTYATAMTVLSMTVSYRQLPIYQRHD